MRRARQVNRTTSSRPLHPHSGLSSWSGKRAAKQTIEMDPNFTLAHTYLGMAYASDHRDEEAAAELRQGLGRSGRDGSDRDLGLLGLVLGRQGRTSEAREVLRTLERDAQRVPVDVRRSAGAVGSWRKDRPLVLLNQAVDEHHPWAIHFNVDPALDGLRSEPRFTALLQRIGIPMVALPTPR